MHNLNEMLVSEEIVTQIQICSYGTSEGPAFQAHAIPCDIWEANAPNGNLTFCSLPTLLPPADLKYCCST